MKNYEIIAGKEVVATFAMDYTSFKMKFENSKSLADWIKSRHPELKDVPHNAVFPDNKVVIEFYSIDNLVIEEK